MSGALTAEDLRRNFDQTFALPPPEPAPDLESLILVRAGGQPLALRSRQIAGVFPLRSLVPLPSPLPGLLGLAALRGLLVAVFDLAALLELPSGPPHYVVLAPGMAIAFGFDALQGQVSVPSSQLLLQTAPAAPAHRRELARLDSGDRAVADLVGLAKELHRRASSVRHSDSVNSGAAAL